MQLYFYEIPLLTLNLENVMAIKTRNKGVSPISVVCRAERGGGVADLNGLGIGSKSFGSWIPKVLE